MDLRSVGPFLESNSDWKPPKTQDASVRFTLDKGFLALGLDGAANAVSRLEPLRKKGLTGRFSSGTVPFRPTEIEESKTLAAEWRRTSQEERALAGSYPALLSYFHVVQQTETLAALMMQVVERPSLLSIAANLGIRSVEFDGKAGASLSAEPDASWGLPEHFRI